VALGAIALAQTAPGTAAGTFAVPGDLVLAGWAAAAGNALGPAPQFAVGALAARDVPTAVFAACDAPVTVMAASDV
jgi:hypothetical protein